MYLPMVKTFKQFLDESITLYHGSHSKRKSLRLPKHHIMQRAADGHAVYLTNKEAETHQYGKHLHTVSFNVNPKHLIDMDAPLHKQSRHVKQKLKSIAPELFHPSNKHMDGLAARQYLDKKHGSSIKVSKLLDKAGIPGGHGESLYNYYTKTGKERTGTSRVYSSYNPKRDIKVTTHKVRE